MANNQVLTPLGALRQLAGQVTSRIDELAGKVDAAVPYPGPAIPAPPTLPATPELALPTLPTGMPTLGFFRGIAEVRPTPTAVTPMAVPGKEILS